MGSAEFFLKSTRLPLCCTVVLLVFSCATGSFAKLDNEAEHSRYAESAALLEKRKNSLYAGSKDRVLYFLDKGMLSHYAGDYEQSSQLLESGEQAIEAAYTRSVTREIGSYLLNDTVLEYPGEDYEDIYINSFNALNYYYRGNLEDAMVEIRRMNNKTARLSTKYNVIATTLQKEALELGQGNLPANLQAAGKFTDSALARYLGMLFYRNEGLYDDARIDSEGLRLAFANAPSVYNYPPPSSISGELNIPKGMARFNAIAFSGLSPVKQSRVLRIPLPGPRWVKIALPELEQRGSEVTQIEVVFDHGQRFKLELLEDIEAVTRETFKARQNVIYLKSILRAMVKGLSSSALDIAAQEAGEEAEISLILGILSITTQIFAEASEQADLRISRYFPARAYVGGVNIAPGIYSFQINYYNESGKVIDSIRYNNMRIREDALNLAEAVCLK
ncbi:MAG: hypothetical protein LBD47_01675 [Treponema sp.]|jgi:hypothetical protein|nr:hypothetical protein [Treponema sp.]